MSVISRPGQTYSASGPQLRSLKGDAQITREFATRRIPQWPTNARRPKYDLWLHLQLVGPSYSPARRPPKKSLGRDESMARREGGTGQNYWRGRLSARVFSTRCTVVRYASSLVLHDRLNRILVKTRRTSSGTSSGRGPEDCPRKY